MTTRIVSATFTATEFTPGTVPGLLRITASTTGGVPDVVKETSDSGEEFDLTPGVAYKMTYQRLDSAGQPLGAAFVLDYTEPGLPVMVDIPTGGAVA